MMRDRIFHRRTFLRSLLAGGCGLWMPSIVAGFDPAPGANAGALAQAGVRRAANEPATPTGGGAGELSASAASAPRQVADWVQVSELRVVFGHQSVGNNIISGIERLAARDGVRMDIRQRRQGPALPGINHFPIGKNGDPASKIRDFAAAVDAGVAHGADVALMKLCYVDFEPATDARQVANDYIASLDALARRHPATCFVAVTAPLVARQSGPKAWIKRLIAMVHPGYVENARRTEFNLLLRQRYGAEGRLFDLARVESGPSGDGQRVEALSPQLTSDGGHLNEFGQMLAAGALLRLLGSLSGRNGPALTALTA